MIPERSPANSINHTNVKTPYGMMPRNNSNIPEPPPMPNGGSTPPPPPPLPPPPPECLNNNTHHQSRSNSFTDSSLPVGENTPVLPPPTPVKKRKSSEDQEMGYTPPRRRGACNEAIHVLSSLYAKLLVVTASVLVTTEVLHNKIPLLFFHGYLYTYLIGGGIICLMSIYICLMVDRCPKLTGDELERGGKRKTIYYNPDISIFLRTGMLIFGLGALINCGLEIATVFTLHKPCTDEVNMAQPILQGLFTFLQMHFLFLNSQQAVRSLGCFRHIALMHIAGTNLAIWIRQMLWDTTTEWLEAGHVPHNFTRRFPPPGYVVTKHAVDSSGEHKVFQTANCLWKPVEEKLEDILVLRQCLQNSTIGSIWELSTSYLAPFSVQFSLIAAAMVYVYWANPEWDHRSKRPVSFDEDKVEEAKKAVPKKKIDCKGSSKGLFLGLLVLIAGLIIMILFFVLNKDHDLGFDTLFAVIIMHCGVLGTSAMAVMLGLCQIQHLRFRFRRGRKLSDLVQGTAVLSVFAFGIISMIVGGTDIFDLKKMTLFIDGALMVFHAAIQSVFIRQVIEKTYVPGSERARSRPGRQVIMYLVFTNIVLWLVELFTAQKHVASQMQLEFYGILPWGIFTRVAVPLIVFYRFHSSAVLMEAWRKAYRMKGT